MKKQTFTALLIIMTLLSSCCTKNEQSDSEISSDTTSVAVVRSPEAKAMELAVRMANYGRENESAEALVAAANIMLTCQAGKMDLTPVHECDAAPTDASKARSLDPATLLAEARTYASNDRLMTELIDRAERRISVDGVDASRGSVRNAGYVSSSIAPHQSDVYTVEFEKGRKAAVSVIGDGSSDLNLYIYDADGNSITNDMGATDNCYCEWMPAVTGDYLIKIINRGNAKNEYNVLIER